MINFTLEQVLAEDIIGRQRSLGKTISEKFSARFRDYEAVRQEVIAARKAGTVLFDTAGNLTYQGFSDLNRVYEYFALLREYRQEYDRNFNFRELDAEGDELLAKLIPKISGNLPKRPFMLFFTSQNCIPCTYVKSTVAKLGFFSPVPFYYTDDVERMKEEGVVATPTLWLYTDNSQIALVVPWAESTAELWNMMGKVVELSRDYQGYGLITSGKDGVYITKDTKIVMLPA